MQRARDVKTCSNRYSAELSSRKHSGCETQRGSKSAVSRDFITCHGSFSSVQRLEKISDTCVFDVLVSSGMNRIMAFLDNFAATASLELEEESCQLYQELEKAK